LTSTQANYPLNLASAIVLPLQGVWNAVIFFPTSWKVLREEVNLLRAKMRRGSQGGEEGGMAIGCDGPFGRGSGFPCNSSRLAFASPSRPGAAGGIGRGMYDDGWRLAPDEAMGLDLEDDLEIEAIDEANDGAAGRRKRRARFAARDADMEIGLAPYSSRGTANGFGPSVDAGLRKPPPVSVRVMKDGTL
jgi:hypothetical protein